MSNNKGLLAWEADTCPVTNFAVSLDVDVHINSQNADQMFDYMFTLSHSHDVPRVTWTPGFSPFENFAIHRASPPGRNSTTNVFSILEADYVKVFSVTYHETITNLSDMSIASERDYTFDAELSALRIGNSSTSWYLKIESLSADTFPGTDGGIFPAQWVAVVDGTTGSKTVTVENLKTGGGVNIGNTVSFAPSIPTPPSGYTINTWTVNYTFGILGT